MKKVPVFYRDEMSMQGQDPHHTFSPSATKPLKVVTRWFNSGLPIEIVEFEPRPMAEELGTVHDHDYVDGVLAGTIPNGHGNTSKAFAKTLPYTVESFMYAAAAAYVNRKGAVSPTSGFHHAHFDHGGGFCTFNALILAAVQMPEQRFLILDCDHHFGDGTVALIEKLGLQNRVRNVSGHGKAVPAENYSKALRFAIDKFAPHTDIVLYQAGADAHIDDPLGGYLTEEQLYERDHTVFEACQEWGLPVAWNLAGGYCDDFEKTLRVHDNTMKAFCEVWGLA